MAPAPAGVIGVFVQTARVDDQVEDALGPLVRWLSDRYGGGIDVVEPPTSKGEGFDSMVYLLHLAGERLPEEWRRPLVLRVKAGVDRGPEAEREATIQGWLADRGYPAPRVLQVFEAGELLDLPAQVMERAPGSLVLDAIRSAPWRARRLCTELAALHARLHSIPADGFPPTDDLLDRRMRLARTVASELDDVDLRRALERVESRADELRDAPAAICHGDFHPLNVLVAGDSAMVIDWTDAGVGDRHGDIARTLLLFELAAIAASGAVERRVLKVVGPLLARFYRRGYERVLPIDPDRLRLWVPVHLLHGWSQVRALHGGLLDRGEEDDARTGRVPPELLAELRRRFDRAIVG
jgi:aminoglycoside phosphotransferase (APT) family kinase protein